MENKVIAISGADDDLRLFSFQGVLWGISHLYRLGVGFRSLGFRFRLLPQKKLSCPVISVGNIVAGGTGKTPMTIFLTGLLKDLGLNVVVVSRGYKGTNSGVAAVVGDGTRLFLNAAQAGDEPCMMAALKQFPVVIGKNRYQAGKKAIEVFAPDIIVLDDAFQHRQLKRDLNLVLMDHANPLGNKRLLPAGRLREPFKNAIKRADAVIFTRSRPQDSPATAVVTGQAPGIPRFKTCHVPFLADYQGRNHACDFPSFGDLKGKAALLFSGLADNASFYRAMAEKGINILEHLEFKDHYRYKDADIFRINTTAKEKGAQIILTTQKDWVKINTDVRWEADVAIVGIRIQFENKDAFVSLVKERCFIS